MGVIYSNEAFINRNICILVLIYCTGFIVYKRYEDEQKTLESVLSLSEIDSHTVPFLKKINYTCKCLFCFLNWPIFVILSLLYFYLKSRMLVSQIISILFHIHSYIFTIYYFPLNADMFVDPYRTNE